MGIATRLIVGTAAISAAACSFAQFDGAAPVAWRWAESARVAPTGSPVEKDGTVYVAVGGRVYALEKETGNLKWRYPQGAPFESNFRSGVVLSGNKIIAATDNRVLYCLDAATGEAVWQYNSAEVIMGSPVVAGSKVVFAQPNGIFAVGLADGQEAWTKPYTSQQRIYPNLVGWNDFAIFPSSDNKLRAIDANTGAIRWEQGFARLNPTASPVVHGDIIYINASSYVIALMAFNGRMRWQNSVPDTLAFHPAVSDRGVVSVTNSGKVFAFDLNGRKINAQAGDLKSNPIAAPAYVGDLVAVPLANGSIVTMNTVTGDTLWMYNFPAVVTGGGTGASGGGGGPSTATGGASGVGGGTVSIGGASGAGGAAGPPGRGGGGGGGQRGGTGEGESSSAGQSGGSGGSRTTAIFGAGPAILVGDTMLILATDGSLFAFDKKLGVDLTPPEVKMLWPNPGDQISPLPPAEFVFKLEDYGSGINPETVSVTVNGKEVASNYDKVTSLLRITIVAGGRVPPLPAGKVKFVINSSDWMGNTSAISYSVTVDPTIDRPLGAPPRTGDAGGAGGGGLTGPGVGGAGGGGRGGGGNRGGGRGG